MLFINVIVILHLLLFISTIVIIPQLHCCYHTLTLSLSFTISRYYFSPIVALLFIKTTIIIYQLYRYYSPNLQLFFTNHVLVIHQLSSLFINSVITIQQPHSYYLLLTLSLLFTETFVFFTI